MEAIVARPRGGCDDFFDINFRAYLKLQKVAGISGYTKRAFILISLVYKNLPNSDPYRKGKEKSNALNLQ
jgi:hypothetical protein